MESVQSIDAIAPLRESAYAETGDAGTQRPRAKPETRHGTAFQPMDLPDPERPPEISWKAVGACLTPLDLIHCFLPEWLIAQWVEWTNVAIKNGPWKQSSRENNWRDTTLAEVYCFLATLLYMGLYAENSIAAYWSEVDSYPVHFPKYFLARNRFELLFSHLRTWDPSTEEDSPLERIFARVDYLSEWLQKVSLDLLAPGAEVCVDEAMVRFTGRHHATVVIKGKLTPRGFKVWVVDSHGYFFAWLWHVNNQGPVGIPDPSKVTHIDARWMFMKIFSDELSGELKILESRKEWLSGNSSACRT